MAWDDHFFCTCRFCGTSEYDHEKVVKYGVRHYAHHECYLRAGKPLADLNKWQIEAFPYRLLKNYKLMGEAQTLIDTKPY